MSNIRLVDVSLRIRLYRITITKFHSIPYSKGYIRIVDGQLPSDAEMCYKDYDDFMRCFWIYVRSSEFDKVEDGDVVPDGGILEIEAAEQSQSENDSLMNGFKLL